MRVLSLLLLAGCIQQPCDSRLDGDADGAHQCVDCDDADPRAHPGAVEVCDGIDDDCDGTVDVRAADAAWFPDLDGDGHGDPSGPPVCDEAPRTVTLADDCDDAAADVFPEAVETWDGRDEDCDGTIDRVPVQVVTEGVLYGPVGLAIGAHGRFAWGGDPDDDGVPDVVLAAPTSTGGYAWLVATTAVTLPAQPLDGSYTTRITRTQEPCLDLPLGLECQSLSRRPAWPAPRARDVTGDGIDDIVIVSEDSPSGYWRGEAFVVAGGDLPAELRDTEADTRVLPLFVDASINVGRPVVALADVDGVPGDDLIFGAGAEEPAYDLFHPERVDEGRWSVFPHGLCRDAVCPVAVLGGNDATTRVWGAPREQLGSALITADVTGDGTDDVILGAPGRGGTGALVVMRGGLELTGIPSTPDTGGPPGWTELRGDDGEQLGARTAALAAGLLTEDRFADVVVTSPSSPTVYVWPRVAGPSGGVVATSDLDTWVVGAEGSSLGASLCALPGVLVIGDPAADDEAGAVYLFRADTLVQGDAPRRLSPDDADVILRGEVAGDRLGSGLSCGVDVDDDGLGDLLIGADGWTRDDQPRRGALLLVRMRPTP